MERAFRAVGIPWDVMPINRTFPCCRASRAASRAPPGAMMACPVLFLDNLVELEEIYIIGFHPLQAELNVLCHAFSVPVFALRGDEDFLPHAGQRRSEFLFASLIGFAVSKKVIPLS